MEISSATPGTASTPNAASQRGALSADFETFLKMLTVQMQNQDPLNPMESTEMSVQLATFSGVEQQVQTNDLLRDLSAALGLDGMSQYAGWIGKEARVAAPAYYQGQPLSLYLSPAALADEAVLIVTDENGVEAQRVKVGTEPGAYEWSGLDTGGIPLADGHYSFELQSLAKGATVGRSTVPVYQPVIEARMGETGVEVVLSGGAAVAASDVTALRNPAS